MMGSSQQGKVPAEISGELRRARAELGRGLIAGVLLSLVALGAAWLLDRWSPAPIPRGPGAAQRP